VCQGFPWACTVGGKVGHTTHNRLRSPSLQLRYVQMRAVCEARLGDFFADG
jgi:hypothetical protein